MAGDGRLCKKLNFILDCGRKSGKASLLAMQTPAELQHLDEVRQADRVNKAEFDAAAAKRKAYANANRILDAVGFIGRNAICRVGAMVENPQFARLCYEEALARQRWAAGRKAVADLEFSLGVKK
jgi:hypothetical protein